MMKYAILAAAAAAPFANAQAQVWGQCGGQNYNGPKTCVSGSSCVFVNDWYSQCQPGAAPVTSAPVTSAPATSSSSSVRVSSSSSAATKTSSSSRGGSSTTPPPVQGSGNPLAGYTFYNNPYYASEIINLAAPSLSAKGSAAWAAKATNVAKIGTFAWLDTRAKVPAVRTYAEDVQKRNAAGEKLTLPLVVYNLPDRDCAAKASNGELALANNGANLYKGYIDSIKEIVQDFPDVHFTLCIEPDSLANLITNMNVAKCQTAGPAYRELTIYAMKTLNLPNVVMYLDAGHAGWLGWEANLAPAAKLYGSIYVDAGKPKSVRGLAINVSNYNAWSIATCPAYAESNKNCDEKKYANALGPLIAAEGFPAHFIMDTSRNGVQPTKQQAWGNWCNVIGTGFGIRPSTSTDDPLLDAWAWIKPGGECDGTSDTSAVRYDSHCGYPDALKPAPEAGQWFQAYFEQLLVNANPPF